MDAKVGDLVEYVGCAGFYKGRIGVVCKLYDAHELDTDGFPSGAFVYYAGAEGQARARFSAPPLGSTLLGSRSPMTGLHPIDAQEIKVICSL